MNQVIAKGTDKVIESTADKLSGSFGSCGLHLITRLFVSVAIFFIEHFFDPESVINLWDRKGKAD